MAKKTRAKLTPLIIESHPDSYTGYPFITLIQHQHDHVLSIVDNYDNKKINAYILDLCGPTNVPESDVIEFAAEWYECCRDDFPLSIFFSERELTPLVSPIYHTFQSDFITRVIGPLPTFPMNELFKIKRRKRKPIPKNILNNATNVVKIME